jgi:hypothetical protein
MRIKFTDFEGIIALLLGVANRDKRSLTPLRMHRKRFIELLLPQQLLKRVACILFASGKPDLIKVRKQLTRAFGSHAVCRWTLLENHCVSSRTTRNSSRKTTKHIVNSTIIFKLSAQPLLSERASQKPATRSSSGEAQVAVKLKVTLF